jgi:hypothetical protein
MELRELTKNIMLQMGASESRIPYTYHHDLFRKCGKFGSSRSDIARNVIHKNEEDLYLIAFVGFIEGLLIEDILLVDDEVLQDIRKLYTLGKIAYDTYIEKEGNGSKSN